MRRSATHAEAAFLPLDHIKHQAPTPTLSQLAAPHNSFQILDASSLTFTLWGLSVRRQIAAPRNRTVPALRHRTSLQREPRPTDYQINSAEPILPVFYQTRYAKPLNHRKSAFQKAQGGRMLFLLHLGWGKFCWLPLALLPHNVQLDRHRVGFPYWRLRWVCWLPPSM